MKGDQISMANMTLKQRRAVIKNFLSWVTEKGQIVELRVPNAKGGPLSGLFDDMDAMAEAAAKLSGTVPGIYLTLNPVKSLANQVTNQLAKVSTAVRDTDIQRRVWLPIDFDPVRPANTPSTDAEHDAAIALAKECRRWLRDEGWPDPVLADSGNGGHLLYYMYLPNDQRSRNLVSDCLEALSLRFSNSAVRIDTGNFNASRVWRVYGTTNCKGTQTDDRPYRRARVLETPREIAAVTTASLNQLAATLPIPGKMSRGEQVEVEQWLTKYEVPVVADAPWNGDGYKWILQCPWDESHNNNSAFIVQFPDGGIAAGCLHKSCEGRNWPALRAHFEQRSGKAVQPESASPLGNLGGGQKTKQAELLLELGSELELFRTPQGEGYVTFPVKGHRENHPIRSRLFDQFLRYKYFSLSKNAPKPQAVNDALAHFGAMAMFDSPEKPVFIRVAEAGGKNYLDLCDKRWRAVEFDADGWRLVETPPVKFRRTPGMLALPTPVSGGDINELRGFLNLRTDDDWALSVTVLMQALPPTGPFPVLCLHGEAGSAKTTSSRIFRAMIDPNTAPARAMPKDARDLAIMANNGWVLVFDNLSHLPVWFSECLCRLSAGGGGFSTRQLFSDTDEVLFDGQRPLVLNGIEQLASRTDLIDRSVILDLPVIERFTQEGEFWKQFKAAHPRLLGALLTVVVDALRKRPEVQLRDTSRLADYAVFATAAESALGLSKGTFMRAYSGNRENANAVALEASPIASLVCGLAEKGLWEGTAEPLLRKLSTMVEEEVRRRRNWPKSAGVLSGMLRRLAPALRRAGVDIAFDRDNAPNRTRMISIKKLSTKAIPKAATNKVITIKQNRRDEP